MKATKIVRLTIDEDTIKILQEVADKKNLPLATYIRVVAVEKAKQEVSS